MGTNIRISMCNNFYNDKFEYDQVTEKDKKEYRFQVEILSSRHSSGYSRKAGDCSSRNQTSDGLIILPTSSS